ncbi:MAG: hypothetical protein KAT62_07705, partial [Desulfuromonadales bacterium]|nr:hypothetical protein [Desulfuromonadales bacterium]
FSGTKAYIRYVEILKNCCNAGGRTFCDAITIDFRFINRSLKSKEGKLTRFTAKSKRLAACNASSPLQFPNPALPVSISYAAPGTKKNE